MSVSEKFLEVMRRCAVIGCDSQNTDVGYNYVSAAKINAAVNRALTDNRLAVTSKTHLIDVKNVSVNGYVEFLATVEVEITVIDTDNTDDVLVIRGAGCGIDKGDKAVAKAQTMAVKYAWKDSLLIADAADDPDANSGTDAYNFKPSIKNTKAPF